jgi:biopolymer transport protein ExbD
MTKFRKLITPLLITVIICATLALGYQQDPLRLPNPFSGAKPTQEKKDQPVEVKDLYLRINKLESEVSQLEKRIDQLQKQVSTPRVIPLSQR